MSSSLRLTEIAIRAIIVAVLFFIIHQLGELIASNRQVILESHRISSENNRMLREIQAEIRGGGP